MSKLKVATWKWILLFFWLAWPGPGGAQTSPYQAGVDFIWLREGLSGGVAARPLTGEILIVRPAGSQARVYSRRKRTDGSYEFSVGMTDFDKLEGQLLQAGLFALAQSDGDHMVYQGTPTGLQFRSEKYQWLYTPSVGCVPPTPGSPASALDNRRFREAVELIVKSNLGSTLSCAADFERARASLYASTCLASSRWKIDG